MTKYPTQDTGGSSQRSAQTAPGVTFDRRQRRWLEMHRTIYDAACELFLERGFAGTSVDNIAERADVARKTAFNHFPRKRDFIGEWGRRRRARVAEALIPELVGAPELDVVLTHYFAELAKINVAERALTIRMLQGWRECGGPFDADPHQLVEVFAEYAAAAQRRGDSVPALDARRLGTVLYSSYFGLLFDWCDGTDENPPFDLDVVFAGTVEVVLRGWLKRSDG